MARYNLPIPFGWFEIGQISDLLPGQLKELRAFGENLMLWRGEDGQYHLQDTYCPHLGANIGADGKVVGNTVECPFHHWRFDGEGAVAIIPYAPEAKSRACLRIFPVREYHGHIVAWYHSQRKPPIFDLPVIEELMDPAIRGPIGEYHNIETCVQEMVENSVDHAHFVSIHHHPGAAAFDSVVFESHSMVIKTLQEYPSSKGPVKGTLDTYSFGLGMSVVRYKTLIDIVMLTMATPLDTQTTRLHFAVYYKNPAEDPKVERIAQSFNKEVNRQVRQDIPIWNKKIYRERPALTAGEAPITRFRQWVKQFYVDAAA